MNSHFCMPRSPIVAGTSFVSPAKARASVALKALCDKGGLITLKLSR